MAFATRQLALGTTNKALNWFVVFRISIIEINYLNRTILWITNLAL